MSVYTINFTSLYSDVSRDLWLFMTADGICVLNSQCDYTYNKIFSKCIRRHILIGAMEDFRLQYLTSKEKLPVTLCTRARLLQKKYLTPKDKKRLCMLSIPFSNIRSLCLELRKEKNK